MFFHCKRQPMWCKVCCPCIFGFQERRPLVDNFEVDPPLPHFPAQTSIFIIRIISLQFFLFGFSWIVEVSPALLQDRIKGDWMSAAVWWIAEVSQTFFFIKFRSEHRSVQLHHCQHFVLKLCLEFLPSQSLALIWWPHWLVKIEWSRSREPVQALNRNWSAVYSWQSLGKVTKRNPKEVPFHSR